MLLTTHRLIRRPLFAPSLGVRARMTPNIQRSIERLRASGKTTASIRWCLPDSYANDRTLKNPHADLCTTALGQKVLLGVSNLSVSGALPSFERDINLVNGKRTGC